MMPIYATMKQGTYKLTEECQRNYKKIKEELCKMPCFYMLGFSRPMHLFCSKLNRWQLILNFFDIEIIFEPSDSIGMRIVDILSRRPGMKKVANRRPKKHEIDNLPDLRLTEPKLYSIAAINVNRLLLRDRTTR